MFTLPIGFALILATIFFSIDRDSWSLFLNTHAIVITFGGTLAVFVFTTSIKGMKSVYSGILDLFKPEQSILNYEADIKSLAANQKLAKKSKNPLLNHAAELWSQGITPDLFVVLISQARTEHEERYLDAVAALRNVSKYPPALGMIGTVIGMVGLFSNLGGDNQTNIGPLLALALTATFFGLIIANGLVNPLADRIYIRFIQQKRLYRSLYQLLILINSGESNIIVEDEVKSRVA